MKKNKQKDQAFLFEQIERKGDLDFDYADVKTRINVLQYEKNSVVKAHKYRLRPQTLVVACSLLFAITACGFGGFMMSRQGIVTPPETTVNEETVPSPESQPAQKLPNLYPEDVLLWQGEVYIRTDLTVDAGDVGNQLGQIISEADSGSQQNLRDNPQVAIAEHLEDGTPFHQITNEENYIAVFTEDGYVIYQRQLTPDTTTP